MLKFFKKHYELTPLITIVGGACVMAGAYIVYAVATKSDVMVNRKAYDQPWDKVDPTVPQKIFTINQKYTVNPEILKLRKEIGSPAV
ncbi:normal mucosa of esophagus-specific gene 1 protein-like [Glandiceps talaboti]